MKTKVSVIMTALNEEKNIIPAVQDTLSAFEDFDIAGEVVVINDGSTDKTGDLARDMMSKDNRVRLIKHDHPEGVGASFWDGVNAAQGEIVTWIPGDNENNPGEILRYLSLADQVDMVVPFVTNTEVRPPFRNALSRVYNSIINLTFGTNFHYTNGTVLYKRSILSDIDHRARGFFFQTEILIKLGRKKYLFAEVPYKLRGREKGQSKAISINSFSKVAKSYFSLLRDIYWK